MCVQVQRFLEAWIKGTDGVTYTPHGLAWGSEWGSLRFVGNAAMIAAVYSKSIAGALSPPSHSVSSQSVDLAEPGHHSFGTKGVLLVISAVPSDQESTFCMFGERSL